MHCFTINFVLIFLYCIILASKTSNTYVKIRNISENIVSHPNIRVQLLCRSVQTYRHDNLFQMYQFQIIIFLLILWKQFCPIFTHFFQINLHIIFYFLSYFNSIFILLIYVHKCYIIIYYIVYIDKITKLKHNKK